MLCQMRDYIEQIALTKSNYLSMPCEENHLDIGVKLIPCLWVLGSPSWHGHGKAQNLQIKSQVLYPKLLIRLLELHLNSCHPATRLIYDLFHKSSKGGLVNDWIYALLIFLKFGQSHSAMFPLSLSSWVQVEGMGEPILPMAIQIFQLLPSL